MTTSDMEARPNPRAKILAAMNAVLLWGASVLAAGNIGIGMWPSEPPAGCPFPASGQLTGLVFTGRHAEYTGADTWYPSWASDGNLYSPWTEGNVNGLTSNSFGTNATTGFARIIGSDPLDLRVAERQGALAGYRLANEIQRCVR